MAEPQVIADVAMIAVRAHDPDAGLVAAMARVGEALGFRAGHTWRMDGAGNLGAAGPSWHAGDSPVCDDVAATVMAVALVARGQIFGVLELAAREPAARAPEVTAATLHAIGEQLGAMLERETQRKRVAQLVHERRGLEARERRHLADMLHERIGDPISNARSGLAALTPEGETPRRELSMIESALAGAAAATRDLATDLAPPRVTDLGLVGALHLLAREMERRYGLVVRIRASPLVETAVMVDGDLIGTMWRATHELLANVVKHAAVEVADVAVGVRDRAIVIVVEDRGVGFDSVAAPHIGYGLANLREQLGWVDGTVSVEARAGGGARVTLTIPQAPAEATAP